MDGRGERVRNQTSPRVAGVPTKHSQFRIESREQSPLLNRPRFKRRTRSSWHETIDMTPAASQPIRDQIDDLYRSDSRRVFASLVRLLNDFDLADDAMHEAFAAAVEVWQQN